MCSAILPLHQNHTEVAAEDRPPHRRFFLCFLPESQVSEDGGLL